MLEERVAFIISVHDTAACTSIVNRKAGVLDMIRESVAEQSRDPGLGGAEAAAKSRCVSLPWGPIGTLRWNTEILFVCFYAVCSIMGGGGGERAAVAWCLEASGPRTLRPIKQGIGRDRLLAVQVYGEFYHTIMVGCSPPAQGCFFRGRPTNESVFVSCLRGVYDRKDRARFCY